MLLCGECLFRTFLFFLEVSAIKTNTKTKGHVLNDAILSVSGFNASKQVRVVSDSGDQLGIMKLSDALKKAYEKGLDLALFAPQNDPPVCRIMDYGKFKFDRDKKEKEAKKKQQRVDIKEVQLSCLIDTNDFNTKVNNAKRFLKGGDKVKVVVKFRGRQMAHQDIGRDLLARFTEAVSEFGAPEKAANMEGRQMIMFIIPAKQTAAK